MALRPIPVTDPADDRLVAYRHLRDATLRAKVDDELGVFVVEGRLALEQLIASPYETVSVLLADTKVGALEAVLGEVPAPVYAASAEVLAATVGFALHRGVVAVGRRRPPADPAELIASQAPLLVLEGVNDHENLGALFRNARALGAGGVLLDPTCADPLYRRSIRVSLGHVLRVAFATLAPWPQRLAALRDSGYRVLALAPGGSVPIGAVAPGRRVALLVGAEGPGLSRAALAAADETVHIPMAEGVDSLNVATAAAIALHRLAGADLG